MNQLRSRYGNIKDRVGRSKTHCLGNALKCARNTTLRGQRLRTIGHFVHDSNNGKAGLGIGRKMGRADDAAGADDDNGAWLPGARQIEFFQFRQSFGRRKIRCHETRMLLAFQSQV